MFQGEQQFGRHAFMVADREGGAVGLAHEASAGARRVPTPMLLRRMRRERRLGEDSIEVVGEARDHPAVGDDGLDSTVGTLR